MAAWNGAQQPGASVLSPFPHLLFHLPLFVSIILFAQLGFRAGVTRKGVASCSGHEPTDTEVRIQAWSG